MTEINFRWQLFLRDFAVQPKLIEKLTPGEIEVFTYQFDLLREHWSVSEIRKSISVDLGVGDGNFNRITKNIYPKLTDLGIDYKNAKGERSDVVWQWLKQEYPKWEAQLLGRSKLGVEALWSRLKELGRYAPDRMGICIIQADVQKAGALPKDYQPKPFLQDVPKDSEGLKFKIVSEFKGEVLLLNYDEAHVVYCLCPSEFAPSSNLDGGETIVPQPESEHAYLGAEMVGKEEWWGWIVSKMPPLSWLGAARNTALQPTFSRLFRTKNNIAEKKSQETAKSGFAYW